MFSSLKTCGRRRVNAGSIRVVEEAGARVVAAGALIDRSGGKIDFEVESAVADPTAHLPSYEEEDCPPLSRRQRRVKPGSRFVRTAP